MNILFITTDTEDYLSDSLLHGFRHLLGQDVIDFPKKYCMYKNFSHARQLYGNGFTLYRTMEDISLDRTRIFEKVKKNYFDLVIFSDIYRQYGYFYQLLPYLRKEATVICDGEDTQAIFPYKSMFFKHIFNWWSMPKPHKRFLYYKREWTPKTIKKRWFSIPPSAFYGILTPNYLRPISFSIPKEKIVKSLPPKKNIFPSHIVDLEISEKIKGHSKYVFEGESDYYADLQSAKFGITTKRGGWDCMRHYEIAANGAVICFKNLDQKTETCGPHGLTQENCISYNNYDDLMRKINSISDEEYSALQKNSLQWIEKNTTVEKAKHLLNDFFYSHQIDTKFD